VFNESLDCPVDYNDWASELLASGVGDDPSSVHGELCGGLMSSGQLSRDVWLQQLLSDTPAGVVLGGEAERIIVGVYDRVCEQLYGADFDLQLLIPDDDDGLTERLHALGAWCQGFLKGLNAAGSVDDSAVKQAMQQTDVADALSDLAAIAEIDCDAVGSDADEAHYIEISEYVRVAVMLIFTECALKIDHEGESAPADDDLLYH